MHVLIQGPQVARAHVEGSPLALLAPPILLTLVQEEELAGGPVERQKKGSFAGIPESLLGALPGSRCNGRDTKEKSHLVPARQELTAHL